MSKMIYDGVLSEDLYTYIFDANNKYGNISKFIYPVDTIVKVTDCSTQVGYWVYQKETPEMRYFSTLNGVTILKEVKWIEIKR